MSEVVDVVGRWALLSDGDWVTPVLPFHEHNFNAFAFGAAIEQFQRNPEFALKGGIVERVRSLSASKPNSPVRGRVPA